MLRGFPFSFPRRSSHGGPEKMIIPTKDDSSATVILTLYRQKLKKHLTQNPTNRLEQNTHTNQGTEYSQTRRNAQKKLKYIVTSALCDSPEIQGSNLRRRRRRQRLALLVSRSRSRASSTTALPDLLCPLARAQDGLSAQNLTLPQKNPRSSASPEK